MVRGVEILAGLPVNYFANTCGALSHTRQPTMPAGFGMFWIKALSVVANAPEDFAAETQLNGECFGIGVMGHIGRGLLRRAKDTLFHRREQGG